MGNSKNLRGPCPCNLKKIAWKALLVCLGAPAVMAGTIECGRTTAGYFPPQAGAASGIRLDYGRTQLSGSNLEAPNVDGPIPANPHLDALPVLVKIQSPAATPLSGLLSGGTCLLSQAPFYFAREQGLRLALCWAENTEQEERIQTLLREAFRHRTQVSTAAPRPHVQTDQLVLAVVGKAQLRAALKKLGPPLMAVDGIPGGDLTNALGRKPAGEIPHFATGATEAGKTPELRGLGRVFPKTGFHLLVHGEQLVLLYKLNAQEYLYVRAQINPTHAERIAGELEAIQHKLLRHAPTQTPLVTEVYFGDQGPSTAAYVELGTPHRENLRARVRLHGRARIEMDVFLFSGGTAVIAGARLDLRDELRVSVANAEPMQYNLADFRARGAGRGRALSVHHATVTGTAFPELRPARFSRGTAILGNPGLHPRFAHAKYLPSHQAPCRPQDFQLTEWNPFGVRDDRGRLLTGGKFLELRINRDCRNASVVILADTLVLDPGSLRGRRNELILFVGDGALFERTDVIEHNGLRGLKSDASLRALDTADGYSVALHEPRTNAIYISGSMESRFLARVHSFTSGTSHGRKFHGHGGRGLRGDLAPHHAMSPGYAHAGEKPAPMGPETSPLLLSEILPRGARDENGQSIPGDEFLEFIVSPTPGRFANAHHLLISPDSGSERRYIFPPTRNTGSRAYLVLAGNDSVCFPDEQHTGTFVRVPALTLPNGAARYRLYDAHVNLRDELYMDNGLQNRLDDMLRVSYTRTPSGHWRPTSSPVPACPSTRATPGRTAIFAPFILEAGDLPGVIAVPEFVFMGSSTLRMLLRGGETPETLHPLQEHVVAPGDSFTAPAFLDYFLIEIHDAGQPGSAPLFTGQFYGSPPALIIQGVSPVPPAGRVEWIRLCSVAGFEINSPADSLHLHDSNSRDRIVPWSRRRPTIQPPAGLDGNALRLAPGGCALLIDPDYTGGPLSVSPEDQALWTVAEGSALGNGLASGEGLRVYLQTGTRESLLAGLGLPGTSGAYSIPVRRGEYLRRRPMTRRDAPANFEIVVFE